MSIPLNYRGAPGMPEATLDETSAFNARRKTGSEGTVFAGGDFLFRVFPTPQRVFFIKIDTGTNQTLAVTLGLTGLLIQKLFLKKGETARANDRLASYAGKRPALLMSESKDNYILRREEILQPTLEPPSFWKSAKFGRWTFRDARSKRPKKRIFVFEDVENFQAASAYLSAAFGNDLVVRARYDPERNKIVKVKG
jgi:hypothetical protein